MTDEEAARIVEQDLERRDRDETLRNAKKILRAGFGQRLKDTAAAITKADEHLEVAHAEVARQALTSRLTYRAGVTNEAVTAVRAAQQRLDEAKAAYRAVKDADPSEPVPTTPGMGQVCVTDGTAFDHAGLCRVCRLPASRVGRGPVLNRDAVQRLGLTRGQHSR